MCEDFIKKQYIFIVLWNTKQQVCMSANTGIVSQYRLSIAIASTGFLSSSLHVHEFHAAAHFQGVMRPCEAMRPCDAFMALSKGQWTWPFVQSQNMMQYLNKVP